MLVLFLSPVAAQSSGGYEKSKGYASFKFKHDQHERPSGTHRQGQHDYKYYRDQIRKTEETEGDWFKERIRDTDEYRYLRRNDSYINRAQRQTGGLYGRGGLEQR